MVEILIVNAKTTARCRSDRHNVKHVMKSADSDTKGAISVNFRRFSIILGKGHALNAKRPVKQPAFLRTALKGRAYLQF
jgi:hypothetical protein